MNINLRPAYLFETPAKGPLEKWCCRLMGAGGFHWGMLVIPDLEGWICTESIGKGTAVTRFEYPIAFIYRIKSLDLADPKAIISAHSKYGDFSYGWADNFRTALWWLTRHYLHKITRYIPDNLHLNFLKVDKNVNCVRWVNMLAVELGSKSLVPENEYETPASLEQSPLLEYLGVLKNEK
jgi:hypothetical protein